MSKNFAKSHLWLLDNRTSSSKYVRAVARPESADRLEVATSYSNVDEEDAKVLVQDWIRETVMPEFTGEGSWCGNAWEGDDEWEESEF